MLVVIANDGGGAGPKLAVTPVFELIVTTHEPVPEQAPLQPVKTEPEAGVAARLTDVPELYVAEHVAPQLMPAGELDTVPEPVPEGVTDRVNSCTKFAFRDVSAPRVIVQVPVPEQAEPLHPANAKPAAGVAVNVTVAPWANGAEQVEPQFMPAGELVTDPPLGLESARVTVNCGGGCGLNVAVTA